MSRKYVYIPQKVSEVTIPITSNYGKLKVQIRTSFCRNVVAINIWNTLSLKDVAIIKSDILKHYLGMCSCSVGTKITALALSLSLAFDSVIWSNLSYSLWHRESAVIALFVIIFLKKFRHHVLLYINENLGKTNVWVAKRSP